jgi:hypothetical protein
MKYKVNDLIRIKCSTGGYRVWKVVGVVLGAEDQEDHYELFPLDTERGNNIQGIVSNSLIPCIMLEGLSLKAI